MFEEAAWEDFEGPKLSALAFNQVVQEKEKKGAGGVTDDHFKKGKKKTMGVLTKSARKLDQLATSKLGSLAAHTKQRLVMEGVDKVKNSPGFTRRLIGGDSDSDYSDPDDCPGKRQKNGGAKSKGSKKAKSSISKQVTEARAALSEAGATIKRSLSG